MSENSLANLKGPRWKKGESGNPNGRPKKLISSFKKELNLNGYSQMNIGDLRDIYLQIFNLPRSELIKLGSNEEAPMPLRIVAKELLGKNGFKIIESLLDRSVGKPTQEIKTTVSASVTIDSLGDKLAGIKKAMTPNFEERKTIEVEDADVVKPVKKIKRKSSAEILEEKELEKKAASLSEKLRRIKEEKQNKLNQDD